jgi:anion-transporting  ArsA/GET3 family ATPase
MAPDPLLEHRVIVVVGKGGVGKSVISGGLATAASRRGKRTIVAEMNGAETMAALFDGEPVGYEGGELAPLLHAMSIRPADAIEEYLVRMLRFRILYDVVFGNRFIAPFMNGVMGLSDLISMGKVMDLEWERADGSHGEESDADRAWDLVVVDAPATGHGLSLLSSPKAMMDITRVGPLFNNARMIRDMLSDPARATVLLVTLAEDMPVSETIELARKLEERVDMAVSGVIVNGVPPALFPSPEAAERWPEVAAKGRKLGSLAAAAVADAERLLRDRVRADRHIAHLRDELDLPLLEVPLLPRRDLDAAGLADIATHLEPWL